MSDAFDRLQLGPLQLRNRFIKSATNEGMARGGVPSKMLVEHHRRIAEGGVGMTIVAYCAVSADGRTFADQIELNEATLPHLRALTDAVHKEGAAACAQITHGGAFTFLPQLSTRWPGSASGGLNPPGFLVGRPFRRRMTEADLEATAAEFARGARLARDAGFDAVEIHMGHGYLLSQFLSPAYNKRRDDWGGDAEKRTRFPVKVLKAVLDAVGNELAVGCKISVDEGFRGGGTTDESTVTAKALEAAGAHWITLSAGMNVESPWRIFGSDLPPAATGPVDTWFARLSARLMLLLAPKTPFRDLYLIEQSRKIRAAVTMPLAYLGGAKSMEGVRQILADGFDAITMGRALIHDPDLIKTFATDPEARSGCTACNECVAMMYTPSGTHCVLRGANNPEWNRLPAAD